MDISPGRQLVNKHWKFMAAVAVICAIVAFGASFLWSPRYSAETHVLVVPREARFLNAQGQQQPYDPTLVASLSDTYSEFIESRALAELVVKDLHLDQRKTDTSFMGYVHAGVRKTKNVVIAFLEHGFYAEPSAYEGAVADVQGNIKATPVKDSLVIEIKATADDPKLAAAIADTATNEMIRSVRERDQKNAEVYLTFLKGEVDTLSADVAVASEDLREFKTQHKITDAQAQVILIAQSDQSLAAQLTSTDIDLAASRAEYDALKKSLSTISAIDYTTSTVQTGRSTTTLTNSNTSAVYQQLQAQMQAKKAQIAALQAQHDSITHLLGSSTTLPSGNEAQLYQLEFKLSAAQGALSAVQQEYRSQLITSESTPVELSIVDTAAVPIYPDSPIRYLYLLIGLLIGATGGAGLAYYRETRGAPLSLFERSRLRIPRLAPRTVEIHSNLVRLIDDRLSARSRPAADRAAAAGPDKKQSSG